MADYTISSLLFSGGLTFLAAAVVLFLFRKLSLMSTSSINPDDAGLKKHRHEQTQKEGRRAGNTYSWPSRYHGLTLPPGPPGWPIVGNLFQVARSGKPFIHYILDLHRIYGGIFTLRMGTRTLIMLCDAELAHEGLVKGGQLFASRPAENPTRNIFSCDKFTVNSAVYGAEWRSLRRNMVSGMLSQARLREFRPVREAAMDRLIDRIRAEAESSDGAVCVLNNARLAVFWILLAMCFGLEFDEETVVEVERCMKKVLLVLSPRIDDYLPILGPFFGKERKEALRVRQEQIQTIMPLIEKRRQLLKDNTLPDAMPFSYLDSLLDLKVDGREDRSPPSDVELVTLTSEFLNGGTDTTATAIEWSVARLIENPHMQRKLYDEIAAKTTSSAVAQQRKVDSKDVEEMPYLQAFVKEILRLHPPTYFSLTHAASEPGAKLGGYDIPADANLEIYLPLISKDPNLWKDADKFRPERFIGGDDSVKEEETADMTGVRGVRMIPFGAGRRICPGLVMGTTHVALMVARMVQAFEWKAHPSQLKIDLLDKLEFTVVMNTPLRALATPRI